MAGDFILGHGTGKICDELHITGDLEKGEAILTPFHQLHWFRRRLVLRQLDVGFDVFFANVRWHADDGAGQLW